MPTETTETKRPKKEEKGKKPPKKDPTKKNAPKEKKCKNCTKGRILYECGFCNQTGIIQNSRECHHCQGVGKMRAPKDGKMYTCEMCNGQKLIYLSEEAECWKCGGEGQYTDYCTACAGTGRGK